jgi:ubiquinone/menaquinone biosynthesis C-methylase UbiE
MAKPRLPLPQRPDGLTGRLFGVVMEMMNARSYRVALNAVDLKPGERILELGFGTGRFLELVASRNPNVAIAGVDPSTTMCGVARRRLAKFRNVDTNEVQVGLEQPLNWPDHYFNVIVAIHSFQFWAEPERSIQEVRRALAINGRFVLVLRAHPNPPEWLPNPISRLADEVGEARRVLAQYGFRVDELAPSGTSRVLHCQ